MYIIMSCVTFKLVNHISTFTKHTLKNSITYLLERQKALHNEINDKI